MKKNKCLIFFFVLLGYTAAVTPQAIHAQINTATQTPEPEIYLSIKSIEKNLFTISLLYKFPDNFYQIYDTDFFKAEIISPAEFSKYKILYPKPKGIIQKEIRYYETALLIIEVDITSVSNGIYNTVIDAKYQLCDENGTCYLPGKKSISSQIEIDRNNLQTELSGLTGSSGSSGLSGSSKGGINILKYILFAFLGGVLLNLMPCVFPLIAIKTISLTLQSNDEKKKILFSALSYGAGIIVSLVIIALFIIIFKASGRFAGWGFYMQNPKFVILLAATIFLFSLSMFDIFSITFPGFAMRKAEKLQTWTGAALVKNYAAHFFTGIFAVFIAAPCTAPLLGAAIAFAVSANSVIILTFFIFIGAGFATPFVLLGFFPKLIKKLPKPGKWNLILKEIMGFILLGTAIYLISPILKNYPDAAIKIFYFFFITAFAAWCYGKIVYSEISEKIKILLFLAQIIIIICSWFFLFGSIKKDYENGGKYKTALEKEYIKQFSLELLENLNSQNIPLFINIYADWCTTCKINDAIIFSSKEIEDFFAENGIIMLKGDFTQYNSEIAIRMKEYNKTGVPVYAYYHCAKDYKNPVFFPEILTKQAIIKKITDTYLK